MTTHHPSRRSRRALDALALLVPDVQGGVGPFLIVFMSGALGWDAQRIGTVLSVSALAGLAAQAPAGALIDRSAHAPRWIAGALATIAACLGVMAHWPSFAVILLGQSVVGVAGALVAPAVAAVSLGLMGRTGLDARIGRNSALSAAGTVVWALGTGWLAHRYGPRSMFFFAMVLALPTLGAALMIRREDIDVRLARGADHDAEHGSADALTATSPMTRLRQIATVLWQVPGLRVLLTCAFLFHLANAAMLTLVAQMLGHRGDSGLGGSGGHGSAALWLSGSVIATQLISIPIGLALSRWAPGRARRPLFLTAFAVLALRGLLYLRVDHPLGLLALQLLDGAGACLFGIMLTLVIGDLTRGRGHFSLVLGLAGTCVGLGAAASNLLAGHLAHTAGPGTAFALLALVACAALLLFAARMPETGQARLSSSTSGAALRSPTLS